MNGNPNKKVLTNSFQKINLYPSQSKTSSSIFLSPKEKTSSTNIIIEGSFVTLHISRTDTKMILIEKDEKFNCRKGLFHHNDFIGRQYGCKITSRDKSSSNKNRSIYALKPTPTLHTLTLSHRTQIIYDLDVSIILLNLEILPGKHILEAGTGSGNTSIAIAQSIYPTGRLFTCEVNEDRFIKSKKEFKDKKLDHIIDIYHRDVYKMGFKEIILNNSVDAVFLDLPEPSLCMKEVHRVLKKGGRFGVFLPCIEQVQKTVFDMYKMNFSEISTIECVLNTYYNEKNSIQSLDPQQEMKEDKIYTILDTHCSRPHTSYLTFCSKL